MPCLVCLLWAELSMAQVPMRRMAGEVVRYLGLSAGQVAALADIDASLARDLAAQASRAAASQRDTLPQVCRESQAHEAEATRLAQAVLDAAQRRKLATLQEAFVLMPVIESAQRAHLLPGSIMVAPAGLPAGTIEAPYAFRRVSPPALPGCPGSVQTVRPGVVVTDPADPADVPGK